MSAESRWIVSSWESLGKPMGEPSENFARVQQFANRWKKAMPAIPVVFFDERYTSVLAHQAMIDCGLKKKSRRNKALVDEISATIILKDYLETKR